jgi:hypothetical protein
VISDVFHISSFLALDTLGQIVHIVLNRAIPLAIALVDSWRELLGP